MSNIDYYILFLTIFAITSVLFIWGTFGFNNRWIKNIWNRIFNRWEKWEIV